MKIFGVYDACVCRSGNSPSIGACTGENIDVLMHLCKTRELAEKYVNFWAKRNKGCDYDKDRAICYYDECFCTNDIQPCPEDVFLKSDVGGYRECYVKELEVEE